MYAYEKQDFDITDGTVRMLEKIERLISAKLEEEKKQVKSTSKRWPHHFGYLGSLPRNKPVQDECLTCLKMLECRNSSS